MNTRIENWSVNERTNSVYDAPEICPTQVIGGNVYGHPLFDDGEYIYTSPLVWIEANMAKTHNRMYILGTPIESYVEYRRTQGLPAIMVGRVEYNTYTPV